MDLHHLIKIASRQSNTQAERILQAIQNQHLVPDDQVTSLIQLHEDIVPKLAQELNMPEDVVSDTLVDLYALPEVVEALKGPPPSLQASFQQMQEDIASIKDAQQDISNMVQLVGVLSMGSMLFSILSVYSLIYM